MLGMMFGMMLGFHRAAARVFHGRIASIIPSISFLLKGARGTTDEVKVWSWSDPRIQVRQYLDWPHKREVAVWSYSIAFGFGRSPVWL